MKKVLLGFMLVLLSLSTNAMAGDSSKAVIVFDASGSMWGQINGKAKIEIAKEALKNMLKEWNPNVELGLTVYGHRKKGDCNDIESLIPAGKVDKNKVVSTVMSIQPKGKTPISRSLRKVAKELRFTEEKATIILISDGKETCDPDPCGAAKELEKEGIDFITHVIGFNVDKNTDEQLACIAHATGGEYFSAKNANALNKAMKTIVKKVEKKPVVKTATLVPVVRYNMSPDGLNVSGIELTVTQDGTTLYSGQDEAPEVNAKVGKVDVKANYTRASIEQNIEQNFSLKADRKNVLKVLLKSGEVSIDAAEQEGGSKIKASVHIYPVINGEAKMDDEIAWCVPTKSKACVRILPVGDYLLTATYSSMKTQKRFSIKDKEKKKIYVYFKQTGKVYATARETEGGKLISASCSLYNEDKSDSWILSVTKKDPKSHARQVPVGKYTVNCSYNAFKKKDIPVEVKAGEMTHVNVVFGQTGKVYATARETEGGKLISASCSLYNEDKSDSWILSAAKKNPKSHARQVPVGKYTVNCSYNAFKKKDIPVEVKAGEMTHVDVVFPAFFLQSKCTNPGDKVSYEIYAKSGELVFDKSSTCSKKLKVTLDEGEYSIEGKVKDTKATTKIEVSAKEQHNAVLDFTKQNHEEEIKADTPAQNSASAQNSNPASDSSEGTNKSATKSITIGDKVINIEGLSDEQLNKLKDMQKMLQMLENQK